MKILLMIPLAILGLCSFEVPSTVRSTANPDAILGVWQNGSGKGHIQIYKNKGKYFGKIVWLKNAIAINGSPKLDRKNPDPNKRNVPLIGLEMLQNFVYNDGEWTDGSIYNPGDGRQYKAYMKMENERTLTVRGYIGIALFGKTDTWTRVQ